jgi:hypothetical protein
MACRRFSLFLAAALGLAAPAFAQGSFEGAVTYQMVGKTTMVYHVKGTKIRMDFSGGEGMEAQPAVIYDWTSRMLTAIVVAARMYVVTSMDSIATSSLDVSKPTLKATGAHGMVAGVPCDEYLVSTKDHQETVCAAHGMGNFHLPKQGAGMGFETLTLPNGFFPLKVTSIKAGQPTDEMVATKVERSTVDPSLFTVPADYKQLDAKAVIPNANAPQ